MVVEQEITWKLLTMKSLSMYKYKLPKSVKTGKENNLHISIKSKAKRKYGKSR